jgi:hypothetical protein
VSAENDRRPASAVEPLGGRTDVPPPVADRLVELGELGEVAAGVVEDRGDGGAHLGGFLSEDDTLVPEPFILLRHVGHPE